MALSVLVAVTAAGCAAHRAREVVALPDGWHARNFEPVGYTEMGGHPAFKLAVHEKDGRWYLYATHFWRPGFSVIDVTDPARPEVLGFVADAPNTYTFQVDLAEGLMVTSREKPFLAGLGDPQADYAEGVALWSIADPAKPQLLGEFRTGGGGTHRNFYGGGRYMHLSAAMPGYRGNIYVIVDISNPAAPVEAGRWWVPGQHEAGGERFGSKADGEAIEPPDHTTHGHEACGSDSDVHLHGPPYVVGERAYLPYGSAGLIVLDIQDVSRPRQVGRLDFSPPFHSKFGVHSVVPLPDKGLAYVCSESVEYAKGALHHASIVDISEPRRPYLLSLLPEPAPPPGAPYRDYFEKGGWRGPHNFNQLQHNPDVEPQQGLLYLAHFNAGLRAYDVSNSRRPLEVGHFMPPEPRQRFGPLPIGKLALQTEDVLVDRRGYVYISHKNQGIWILRYTGERPEAPAARSPATP
ncbi:LVIVD repeat-containing protein [Myxococcus sp. Y35]|uniref:LVIVD repeat-containing protein n=1 Tax=Pseudomyxococcus flavus TaxID=3115648 RepID=UPI003CE83AC3